MIIKKRIMFVTGMVIIASIVTKISSIIREIFIASYFGTTNITDAFIMSYTVPDLICNIVAGMPLIAAFIPILSIYLENKNQRDTKIIINGLFTIVLVVLVLLAIIGVVFAPVIIRLITTGFNESSYNLSVKLFRIMIPSIVFIGLSYFISGVLHSYKHFLVPAVVSPLLNIGIIITTVFYSNKYGIMALAVGYLIFSILQFLLQLPVMIKNNIIPIFSLNLEHPGIKKISSLWRPLLLFVFLSQLNTIVIRMFASNLNDGSIAILNFANRIKEAPWILFCVAIADTLFPFLSSQIAENNKETFYDTLIWGIKLSFYLCFPIYLGMFVFREPLISLLYQRGMFSLESVKATSEVFKYYLLGGISLIMVSMLVHAYFALQKIYILIKAAGISLVVTICFSILLIKLLNRSGLALAHSLSDLSMLLVLFIPLITEIDIHRITKMLKSLLKIIMISTISVGFGWLINRQLSVSRILENELYIMSIVIVSMILCYYILTKVFGFDKNINILKIIKGQLSNFVNL